jgi:tRNA-2-methylthio-N6-dimethylallyladenosine synthase
MKSKYYIETFGCQMNVHDSEKISGLLKSEGYSETSNAREADMVIFNTCSIRAKAEQKFFSSLGKLKSLKKNRPETVIVIAGCIAQQEKGNILKRVPYVDYVIGPQNLHLLKNISAIHGIRISCEDNPLVADADFVMDRKDTVKALVTIMFGCDNYCSYCVVPYTRGREKSRPSSKILYEVEQLADSGIREITFLGQNVNSYQSDIDFPVLLHKANNISGIERIRFVTSHPKDLSEDLIASFKFLPKVCEHIHLPLQSGSSSVLELMNRKYTYDDYMAKIRMLRESVPDIAITTDIIAGFPYETDKDHKDTIRALKEIQFDGIFAFKYSPRPGTKAFMIEKQIDEDMKSQRLYEILEIQNEITERKNKLLKGSNQEILLETVDSDERGLVAQGRTRTNKIVNCRIEKAICPNVIPGNLIDVVISRTFRHTLRATLT